MRKAIHISEEAHRMLKIFCAEHGFTMEDLATDAIISTIGKDYNGLAKDRTESTKDN
jgi:hypothetical protein